MVSCVSGRTLGWHRDLRVRLWCGASFPPWKKVGGDVQEPQEEEEGMGGLLAHPIHGTPSGSLSHQRISEQVLASMLQAGLADLFPSSQAYSLVLENISTTSNWEQFINE